MGGLLAHNGKILSGYPKVQIFDRAQELEQLLTEAMDLEKGAWQFYQYAMGRFVEDPIHQTFEQISIAEKGHAKLLYRFFQKYNSNPPPFDELYDTLNGEILEGGQSFKDACHNLEQVADNSCFEILNLALAIEYAAFDLYRVMAEHTDNPAARETFLAIAQAEKGHMRALTRTIEKCQ